MLALWLKFKGYVIAVIAAFAFVAAIFFKGKSSGRADAVAKQREIDDEARKRMDRVEPATTNSTIDSLQSGKF